ERVACLRDDLCALRLAAEFADRGRQILRAHDSGEFGEPRPRATAYGNPGAGITKTGHGGGADAAGTAGDENAFAVECHDISRRMKPEHEIRSESRAVSG